MEGRKWRSSESTEKERNERKASGWAVGAK
jgi:hypothetical protein